LVFRREFNAQGIYVLLIFVKFEVEVWPGGSAGGTNKADYLPFGNAHARLDAFSKTVQMGVTARVS
jgi:hypothetical protein